MPNPHIIAAMTSEDQKMFFALALQHHLKRRGRGSVSRLAIDSGISQPQISRIMAGTSMGSVESRIKIAEALGTSMEEMLVLGRSLKSGERRITGPGRRTQDKEKAWFPNLRRLLANFPNAERYMEMVELAAAENDIRLVLVLLRSALEKLEEVSHGDSEHSRDSSKGA